MTKADLFKEPEGFHWGTFQNAKGAEIRYGHVAPEGEIRGTMVILGGFNESIEKYFEEPMVFRTSSPPQQNSFHRMLPLIGNSLKVCKPPCFPPKVSTPRQLPRY